MKRHYDATILWQQSHPWLKPSKQHLNLGKHAYENCPHCGAPGAIAIRAHLRFGHDSWLEDGTLLHCFSCGHVSHTIEQQAALAAKHPAITDMPMTALNAQLWSSEPTFLNIEPTTRCNFDCWYCVGRKMEQRDLAVSDFATVLDNYPSIRTIGLVGEGEPLLHKGYFDMVRLARDRGIRVMMISNGSAFSESVIRKICEAGITYISISIDSTSPEEFAQSRIKGNLQKVLDGIAKLRQWRDTNGYQYPKIAVKGTLFHHTRNELLPIVELAKSYGAEIFESFQALNAHKHYIPIYPKEQLVQFVDREPLIDTIVRDSATARERLQSVEQFCAEEGIAIDKNGAPNGLRANCDEEWIYALVTGDVTPCCQIKQVQSPNWNLFTHRIGDILADHDYQNMRFNLWNGLFPDYCSGCSKTGLA